MASSSNKGAAEEPEPEPGPPSPSPSSSPSSSAVAPYDPREYQPAHPDDRGGDGKPAKKGGGAKAKGKDGAEGKGKADHDEDDGTHRCGNCDAPDAKSKCKGCGVEYYCNRACQTVGLRLWVGSTPGARTGGGDARSVVRARAHAAPPNPTTTPGALEVRRPQDCLPRLRPRRRRPLAAARDGRRDRDAAGGDGSGEWVKWLRWWCPARLLQS